ncbi:MAG: glycerophosphodiester phosphodiesterase, partial [Myxococcaceae bacterium]
AVDAIGRELEKGDGTSERLAVHHIFDKARLGGYLPETLELLKKTHPSDEVVAQLISQANPKVKPVEITHRGTIGDLHPENTVEGIKDAVKRGVQGLELDLCLTRDGKIVLWHDENPGDATAWLRRNGFETVNRFEPRLPKDEAVRKPIHELTLEQVQRSLGYRRSDEESKLPYQVPTFESVASYLKEHPEVKTLALDVKLPKGDPGLHQRFATELDRVLTENDLGDRVFLMHPDAGVVKNLKSTLGDKYPLSPDVDISALVHEKHSGFKTAKELNTSSMSIGRQPFGLNAYDSFLESVKGDRTRIEAESKNGLPPRKLYVWTLDDELEMREAIALGVDGVVTNRPFMLQKVLRAYWP